MESEHREETNHESSQASSEQPATAAPEAAAEPGPAEPGAAEPGAGEPGAAEPGAAMGRQIEALREGAQFVVGTPGRVMDHLRRGTLRLGQVQVLVLDEADEMLSMGFLEDILTIIAALPKERQTLLFSATVPDEIQRIATRHMRDPQKIEL